jgi:hypothetical protein
MRDRAVELARQGFRVFPLPVGRKDPPITPAGYTEPPEGEYHQHIPTSDPKEAARMWTGAKGQSLDYNIGYCTNDFFAVDIDNKNGKNGEKAFAELVAWYGLDVNTVEARTPTGGRHLLYKLPNGGVAKNTASRLGDGVDTRGWHGYLVAPGSRVTAGEYTWVRPPGSVPMATVPAELLARVLASKEKPKLQVAEGVELDRPEAIESATKWLQDHAPEAHEGCGGDLTTYRVACNVKDFGISQDMCLDLLAEHWNDQKAAPPWSIDELEVKVENA